jgi:hypothetical protein
VGATLSIALLIVCDVSGTKFNWVISIHVEESLPTEHVYSPARPRNNWPRPLQQLSSRWTITPSVPCRNSHIVHCSLGSRRCWSNTTPGYSCSKYLGTRSFHLNLTSFITHVWNDLVPGCHFIGLSKGHHVIHSWLHSWWFACFQTTCFTIYISAYFLTENGGCSRALNAVAYQTSFPGYVSWYFTGCEHGFRM